MNRNGNTSEDISSSPTHGVVRQALFYVTIRRGSVWFNTEWNGDLFPQMTTTKNGTCWMTLVEERTT